MLTCQELTEVITTYLEGGMSFIDRLRFRAHLGMCRHCRTYLHQMSHTIRTLGTLPTDAMPADVRDELLMRFRDWKA